VPIDKVARRFGLAISALRYCERRGLLESPPVTPGGAGTGGPNYAASRLSRSGSNPRS
jgi:MerR family regulatory protein